MSTPVMNDYDEGFRDGESYNMHKVNDMIDEIMDAYHSHVDEDDVKCTFKAQERTARFIKKFLNREIKSMYEKV